MSEHFTEATPSDFSGVRTYAAVCAENERLRIENATLRQQLDDEQREDQSR